MSKLIRFDSLVAYFYFALFGNMFLYNDTYQMYLNDFFHYLLFLRVCEQGLQLPLQYILMKSTIIDKSCRNTLKTTTTTVHINEINNH